VAQATASILDSISSSFRCGAKVRKRSEVKRIRYRNHSNWPGWPELIHKRQDARATSTMGDI
jgi:hypothetical protein